MRSPRVTNRRAVATQDLDLWPEVNTSAFSGEDKELNEQVYRRRKQAIRLYASNESLASIFNTTSITRQEIYRLLPRCLSMNADGRIEGFRGLSRYRHLEEAQYRPPAGRPEPASLRNLRQVFTRFPTIRQALHDLAIFGKTAGIKVPERHVSIQIIHKKFLDLCDSVGIKSPDYPYNFESDGKPAIRRWVRAERQRYHLRFLSANDPAAAKEVNARGRDGHGAAGTSRIYKEVQCDGHKIDMRLRIELPSPTGSGTIFREISRIWIIALVEVMSRAVLGYSISFGRNYSATDVTRAIRHALKPWQKRRLTVQTIDYGEGDGMPSGSVDGLSYACFDELRLDNAKAHLSAACLNYIERTVGAVPVLIPFGTPNANPYAEGFFHLLEEAGIHRMTGTTGSHPKDPRGKLTTKDPRYLLSPELLEDLIDLVVTRINGEPAPHSSISKLEALDKVVKRRKTIIRRIPLSLREEAMRYDMWEDAVIATNHRRPVVRYQGAMYDSDGLVSSHGLIEKRVLLLVDSDDLRTIECVLEDGTPLGTLYVEPRWRRTKHSLITRKEALKAEKGNLKKASPDIPTAFRLHLQIEAAKSKRAAAQLERVKREQGIVEIPLNIPITEDSVDPARQERPNEDINAEEAAYAEAEALLKGIRTQYRRS